MRAARAAMWGSFGLIAWAYAGYPVAAALAGRLHRYTAQTDESYAPDVTLVVAAHNEEAAIAETLERALDLDYPGRLDIVVASDGSTDSTDETVNRFANRGVRLLELPRGGKVEAQNAAVAEASSEIVAFADANARWEPDALRLLAENLADSDVGYVCGRLVLDSANGSENLEGMYWRFELWLRGAESAAGSITAGNGAIYAVRRSAYLPLKAAQSHDLGLPFRLRRSGLRSVYEPRALAVEEALPRTEDEWPRKVRMLSRAWAEVVSGEVLDPRGQPPGYYAALLSHRVLRYAAGPLHLALAVASLRLVHRDRGARLLLGLQLGGLALAVRGRGSSTSRLAGAAWYYVVVNAASVAGLARALSGGGDTTWAPERR